MLEKKNAFLVLQEKLRPLSLRPNMFKLVEPPQHKQKSNLQMSSDIIKWPVPGGYKWIVDTDGEVRQTSEVVMENI
eukprot:54628-Eustigmatos_ZCMA.PRE.1